MSDVLSLDITHSAQQLPWYYFKLILPDGCLPSTTSIDIFQVSLFYHPDSLKGIIVLEAGYCAIHFLMILGLKSKPTTLVLARTHIHIKYCTKTMKNNSTFVIKCVCVCVCVCVFVCGHLQLRAIHQCIFLIMFHTRCFTCKLIVRYHCLSSVWGINRIT